MGVIGFLVILLAVLAFTPWVIMLLVGALWHEFGILQPISFWQSVLISIALSVIGSFFRNAPSS